jgi:translocation protein SEC62
MERRILLKADKFDEDVKKAYPKKVKPMQIHEIQGFDEKKLYVVFIERPVLKSTYFYLSLVIFVILAACLFPVWPLWLKLFVWWALFILLCSLVNRIFRIFQVFFKIFNFFLIFEKFYF